MDTESSKGVEPDGQSISCNMDRDYISIRSSH